MLAICFDFEKDTDTGMGKEKENERNLNSIPNDNVNFANSFILIYFVYDAHEIIKEKFFKNPTLAKFSQDGGD